ncbi:helix-turn-helix domain-containing protein [Sphingomonas cavernae]|uniref:Uncharacterized protein n=1 Tax=Sphingomonas cavernae TaxID=2320861 RepID=A0A418WQT2_9SPHN|nr:helix-turn-helix domain-containing protein [Sphingomonas cavernae]RJF93608.1 hypothetical protein D3876_04660 [Sphingomonas cavernae]
MITLNAQPLRDDNELARSLFSYAKGEVLYRQDDRADCWFEVVSGIVRTCRLYPDGRRQLMGFFYPGDAFGVDHDFYKASGEAVTDKVLARRHLSRDALIDDAALHRALKSAEDCIFLLGHRTAAERLAAFLLAFGERTGAQVCITLPMSRCDIADYLGLTIETVSRTMSDFVRRGLVALDAPQRVRILDARQLSAVAGDLHAPDDAEIAMRPGSSSRGPSTPQRHASHQGR